MRILFLTTRLPFPPFGGERLRPFYFIKHLPRDWEITLLAFVESGQEEGFLKQYNLPNVKIITVRQGKLKSYIKCLMGVFSNEPLEVAYYESSQMKKIVEQEVLSGSYDLIFCHLLRMAMYVADFNNIKKVLDMSDALSLRYALSCRFRRSHFKLVEWLESKRLFEFEPMISQKFDLNLVASSADKLYLEEEMGVKNIEVMENGVDIGDTEAAGDLKKDDKKIVFFGNLRTFHNIDAVLYFYKKIFPIIRRSIKDAKFVIVGASVPRVVSNLTKDRNVILFQDVESIRPVVEDACVSVAPMRIAVGIQNKIIQSMSFGLPVVTTTLGLGGISAVNNKELLVADNPEDFAACVIRLMGDQSMRARIADNAYTLIKNKYIWQDIISKLDNRLTELVTK